MVDYLPSIFKFLGSILYKKEEDQNLWSNFSAAYKCGACTL